MDRRDALNLSVLRRFDPCVRAIVGSASHVVLYTFDVSKHAWQRSDVEGTIFVVERQPSQNPAGALKTFRLVVMNRVSDDNFLLDIGPAFKFDIMDPYLMFSTAASGVSGGTIYGAWFHSPKERGAIVSALSTAAASSAASCVRVNGVGAPPPRHRERVERGVTAVSNAPSQPDAAAAAAGGGTPSSSVVLGREELKAVLLSLIANDRFVDIIHAEYLARQNKTSK